MTITDERKKEVDFTDPYFESTNSLGMTYGQAMLYIILPQAFKRILYLIMTLFLSRVVSRLEKKMNKGETDD